MTKSDRPSSSAKDSETTVRTRKFLRQTPTIPLPIWRRRWIRVAATTLFILLPVIAYVFHTAATAPPRESSITIGPGGGRHEQVERHLRHRLQQTLNVVVEPVESSGSLENTRLLQVGEVDFAIYQTGTEKTLGESQFQQLDVNPTDERLTPEELPLNWQEMESDWERLDKNRDGALEIDEFRDLSSVRFVANLFSEAIHILVRKDSPIQKAGDLRGARIAVGTSLSGDYAMSVLLLRHLGIDELDIKAHQLNYEEIGIALTAEDPEKMVDAAIMSAALGAPQFTDLIKHCSCRIIPVPRVDAMTTLHLLLTPAVIPAGLYHSDVDGRFVPQTDTATVAARAQLLAHADVDPLLVRQVTRAVLNDTFERENKLVELYAEDPTTRRNVAQTRPEFPIHNGAKAYYDPAEFDAGIFEGWEALYSLIASSLLALFVLTRWFVRRREKIRGHQLDEYLGQILDIELRQLNLDSTDNRDDSEQLQKLLDEVTVLRQQALAESSAFDLKDDPAQACFLQMCHYISEKINAKLLRQRLDHRFEELRNVLASKES